MEEKKKILIVDDEVIGAMGIAHIVQSWGLYVCEIAGSFEDAIKNVESWHPDLILHGYTPGEKQEKWY